MKVVMYTDGAALGNPGPGGYGVVLRYGPHLKEISAGYRLTTNNRMELLAVIVGLEALKMDGVEVDVYTDSMYVCNAVEKKWLDNWVKINFKDKANADLWRRYLVVSRKHTVKIRWVRGHNGVPDNERCDVLATTAARQIPDLVDTGYEIAIKGGNTLV